MWRRPGQNPATLSDHHAYGEQIIMKRREFLASSALGSVGLASSALGTVSLGNLSLGSLMSERRASAGTRKILIAGGNFNTPFIRYMASLTGKTRPKLLYLPTASADRPDGSIRWFEDCAPLDVEASVQESFISSYRQTKSWEEALLSVDGIVASGGNTLNQQAIWKAQGIDTILHEAWDRGIVLGGASAGSLCWFEEGTTDSRPKELSIVKCLGFVKGSHCPHYDREAPRRPLYQKLIGSGEMKPGYACDNNAGIYFEDNDVKRVVHTTPEAKVYYVSVVGGKVVEKPMEPETIA
jgi:dipeptidase E